MRVEQRKTRDTNVKIKSFIEQYRPRSTRARLPLLYHRCNGSSRRAVENLLELCHFFFRVHSQRNGEVDPLPDPIQALVGTRAVKELARARGPAGS